MDKLLIEVEGPRRIRAHQWREERRVARNGRGAADTCRVELDNIPRVRDIITMDAFSRI